MSPELQPFITPRFAVPRKVLPHLIFWFWNTVFLAVAAFGIAPLVTAGLLAEALGDWRNGSLIAAALLVIAVPLAATLVGAVVLRGDPRRLLRLFYAVEAPLFLLALARLFLVREVTAGVGYVLLAAIVGISAYVYRLLRNAEEKRRGRVLLALVGDTIGLWIAGYAAVVLAFFAIPAGWASVAAILKLGWLPGFFTLVVHQPALVLMVLLGGALVLSTGTLFGLLPPALIVLYLRRFRDGARWSSSRIGVAPTVVAVTITSTLLVGGFFVSIRQPQRATLAMLTEPPRDDAERRARLAHADDLRDGLVNTYLARFRYLGSTGDANAVRQLWHDELGLGPVGQERVQGAFNVAAAPFLFDGDMHPSDSDSAADAYKLFFDQSIQRGDRARVVAAAESTYSREEREAGLIAQGERKVHVMSQGVRIVEAHGDLAEIELHEVYQNRTSDPQEVLYYFSLPETAAVTGLWLGETDRREDAYAFTISPRGAAQKVYRAEVQRRRDPALLEQIGPRQYRLRAFPVAAKTIDVPTERHRVFPTVASGRPMHLWMRYQVLADGSGFPLPHLVEERNAFRDRDTSRSLGGHALSLDPEVWLPASIAAEAAPTPSVHSVRLDADTVVVATPEPAPTALPTGQRFALVLDRSYSMRVHAREAKTAIDRVRAALAPNNDLQLYLTSSPARGEPPLRLDDLSTFDAGSVIYYGGQDPAELLEQLDELRGERHYDGVLVLTDEGGLDFGGVKRTAKDFGAPVWMVHLGGVLAPGYDDATLETLQRHGGGAVTSVDEALTRLGAASSALGDLGWADGYRFRAVHDGGDDPTVARGFAAIAARRYIPGAARAAGIAGLDAAHALARTHGVVTAYSSMIVLVNDAQRRALKDAEAKDDRFDRAVETGESTLDAPTPALSGNVTGTPEPEEWALLALTALGLAWVAKNRGRRFVLQAHG